ncbi:hypothetical protein GOD95_16155, partial [Paeniclostridium sordellii]|nr:hypothetical protein [Paeniclostridium sordellii]
FLGGCILELKFDFLILINFIICYIFFRGLYLFIKNYKLDFKIEITNFGFYISIVAIMAATMFPIKFNADYKGFEIYNIIPFKVVISLYKNYSFGYFLYQTLGNILLFVPFGFFTYSKSGFDLNKTIVTCFLSSLFIEFVQGFIPYRFCEIDDLWLNTLGGFIGGVIYIYLLKVSSRYTKFSNLN